MRQDHLGDWAKRLSQVQKSEEEIERIPRIKEGETRQNLEYTFLKGEAQDAS
jgi:hypothetical protein